MSVENLALLGNLRTLANAVELGSSAAVRLVGSDEVSNNLNGVPVTKAILADALAAKIQRRLQQKSGV